MSYRITCFIGADDQNVCMGRNYNNAESPANSAFEAACQHAEAETLLI